MFPLYFQAVKPRFRVRVEKLPGAEGEQVAKELHFKIRFANNATVDFPLDASAMKPGDRHDFTTPPILLAPTGDASVQLTHGMMEFHTLYAFYVSSEAALVFLVLGTVLAAAATLILRFGP